MKKKMLMKFALIGLLLIPTSVLADATKAEWFGDWAMNHDGLAGTLRIADSKADCASSAWCEVVISYLDDKGKRHTGRIEKFDDKWQHLVFVINFPNNPQKFDGYIFSWDKSKMAGTTIWQNRKFGFYATKK